MMRMSTNQPLDVHTVLLDTIIDTNPLTNAGILAFDQVRLTQVEKKITTD